MKEEQDLQAEESLIGHLITFPTAMDRAGSLTPDYFWFEKTRLVFEAISFLDSVGKPIELITIAQILGKNGGLERVGGKQYLMNLVARDAIGSATMIPFLVDRVAELATRRDAKLSLLRAQDALEADEPDEAAGHISKARERLRPSTCEFPDVMSKVAGRFAELYSKYLEAPAHFFYMAFLTCLGAVLANRVRLASELDTQARLYTILLGESADDRKSTALMKTVEFFKETVEGFTVCLGIGSGEGLETRLKKNKDLLLCFDEFKQFTSKCRIEGSVLLPMVGELFELAFWEATTKKSHIEINDAHLSLLAASTVQTWETIWTSQFTDIGFNNRLWVVPGIGERKFSLPGRIPQDEKQPIKNGVRDILRAVGEGIELDLTEEARKLYQKWYEGLERSIHAKRLDTYTRRLMVLLTVNEGKDEVDVSIVEKIIALADWQLEVRRLHDPIDAENNIARMEERIRRVLRNGPKNENQLRQYSHADRHGLWFYGIARDNLRKFGQIVLDRKTRMWRLA